MTAEIIDITGLPELQTRATFSMAVETLAAALDHCAAAVMAPGTGPLPILSHVALRVTSGHVTLFATDLEWGVTVTMPALDCEGEWTAALPAGRTAQLLKRFAPKEVVTVSRWPIEGPVVEVVVEVGRSKSRLKAIEDDSFPEPPAASDVSLFSVQADTLAQHLGLVRPFTAKGGYERQILGGVAITVNEYGVGYLATTTQVVADVVDEGAFTPGPEFPTEAVVIPATVCKQIEDVADRCGTDPVQIFPVGRLDSPRALVFDFPLPAIEAETDPRTSHMTIFARVMEGVYPDVAGKILAHLSGNAPTQAIVRPKAMLTALSRIAAVAETNHLGYTSVSLTPLVEEGAIRIHGRGVQAGEGSDLVSAEVTGLTAQEHVFHLGNLRSVLRVLSQGQPDDQTVTIAFRPNKPARFTDARPGYTQALFPIKT